MGMTHSESFASLLTRVARRAQDYGIACAQNNEMDNRSEVERTSREFTATLEEALRLAYEIGKNDAYQSRRN